MSWIEIFNLRHEDVFITPDIEGFKILVEKVIHTAKSTSLTLVPVKDDVEYESVKIVFSNDFFFNDFNYLCDMLKEQLEHKHKLGEEINLESLFYIEKRRKDAVQK